MSGARIEARGGGCFAVHGELGFATAGLVREQARALFRDQAPREIDLGGVSRSDSAGVALLVDWLREARRGGAALRFLNVPDQMRAIIGVCDLEGLLPRETA